MKYHNVIGFEPVFQLFSEQFDIINISRCPARRQVDNKQVTLYTLVLLGIGFRVVIS